MDAKNDQTLTDEERSRVFQLFSALCVSFKAFRLVNNDKFVKKFHLDCSIDIF